MAQQVDRLLSSEDRFDVWNVKKEERPYLLLMLDESKSEVVEEEMNGTKDDEDDKQTQVPPLIDGCDIPSWRKHNLVSISSYAQGILNVGSGCSLFRREAQIPIITTTATAATTTTSDISRTSKWKELQAKLLNPPPPSSSALRLSKEQTIELDNNNNNNNKNDVDGSYCYPPWFEKENIPVILDPVITQNWAAMKTCTWGNLLKEYGHYTWRFSDTHGACMTLETYTRYVKSIEGLTDDAPLAIYDSQFHLDERKSLLMDYHVPKCFAGFDLFQDVLLKNDDDDNDDDDCSNGDDSTVEVGPPPYRWILMGPARSGTGLHIDPMGTHAWVTVVEGCKRWVLFPPSSNHELIGMRDGEPQIPSSIWFAEWYPNVMPKFPNAVEVLQYPGETVYVPAGWPHLVLNLDDTVAITQNYATEYPNFNQLRHAVQESEPDLYNVWVPKLIERRQDLAQQLLLPPVVLVEEGGKEKEKEVAAAAAGRREGIGAVALPAEEEDEDEKKEE